MSRHPSGIVRAAPLTTTGPKVEVTSPGAGGAPLGRGEGGRWGPGGAHPGRAPGGPPNGQKRPICNIFQKWCCARLPPLSENRRCEPLLALVMRLLGLWGSMGLGGVALKLVHFYRHQAPGQK